MDAPHERSLLDRTLADVRYYRFKIFAFVLFSIGLAGFYLLITPPSYTSEAQILLEGPAGASEQEAGKAASMTNPLDNPRAESQIQVLRSERLMRYVFDLLQLADDPSFNSRNKKSTGFIVDWFRGPSKELQEKENRILPEEAFNRFAAGVSSKRIGQSYVAEISYTANDPIRAAKFANSIAMAYIRQQVEGRFAATTNGTEYLQGRVKSLQTQLDAATKAILTGAIPDKLFPDADARVIGAALPPTTVTSPKKGLTIIASIIFGIFIPLSSTPLKNNFRQR